MNSRISLIYKLLLLTSIISSGVLFIIVAAEHGINIGQMHQETKDKHEEESKKLEVEKAVHDKPVDFDSSQFQKLKDEERQLDQQIRSSFDEAPSEELKEQPLKAESGSLFQNHASITDEFSETGHAVVLTLVDSASQELQQQAAVVTKLLAASADADNQTVVTSQQATAAAAAAAGPVTVPLPVQSDAAANLTDQADTDLYVVRAEPKQVDATSQPAPASSSSEQQQQQQQSSSDGGGSQAKSGREGAVASDSLQGSQDIAVGDVSPSSEVGTGSNKTASTTNSSSSGGGGEVVSSSHEEIPSFSEWAQKQLAEAEKKKSENKTRGGGGAAGVTGASGSAVKRGSKQRSKNYASPDCGAKVVSTNPEASSVWAVLSTSRDEYLLNSCHNKIWFVVELCEAIQPEKIELANFELFSSILREFSVSVSDRHPTREWTQVAQLEAREVRTVQSFALKPGSAFVKYIRVEFHSHYGAEHYCPISLFRVYGTSEFEVLDTVDEAHTPAASMEEEEEEEFDEEEAGVGGGEGVEKPRNLFSSARDAVLSIVKRAAQVLSKGEGGEGVGAGGELEGQGNSSVGEGEGGALVNCVTPAYIIVCDNCSDALYNRFHRASYPGFRVVLLLLFFPVY
ncbi:hypothetical protein LSTR_LSTR006132 [Laodelphax striatellus]|uniref:SUN domain-containing protein n=1 Tax=Laodelphax striatellus TaxID=195883 RepID=A0A482WY63_LAOST|nr:hypothetical protein LSTR_LSTR006132 [Laodelphax striatellus]